MNVYWLARAENGQVEGPFPLGRLRAMHEARELPSTAIVCGQGETEWMPLRVLLGMEGERSGTSAQSSVLRAQPVMDFYAAMQERDAATARACGRAVDVMAFFICLLALIPGVGAIAGVFAYGVFALVGTVLAIVQMVKGNVRGGVGNLLVVVLVVPVMMFILQAIGLAMLGGAGAVGGALR